jgi:hypothetical protein
MLVRKTGAKIRCALEYCEGLILKPWRDYREVMKYVKDLDELFLDGLFELGQHIPLVHAYVCMMAVHCAITLVSSANESASARDRKLLWEGLSSDHVAKSIEGMSKLPQEIFLCQKDLTVFHTKTSLFKQG